MGMGKINLSKSTFLILFLAVGFFVGISFSSVYAGIPWDTAEIADNAITSEKIQNKQVKGPDIKRNVITTGKIRDGTIQGVDIADNTIGRNHFSTDFIIFKSIPGDGSVPVWNPNGVKVEFTVTDNDLTGSDAVFIHVNHVNTDPPSDTWIAGGGVCGVRTVVNTAMIVTCTSPPSNGATLNYIIVKMT